MALLETFEILFKSNSREVEEGAEQAEDAVNDVEQSLLQTDKAAEKLGESFTDLIGGFSGAIAGLLGVGSLVAATLDQVSTTDALGKFSDALGLNIEEVGAWGEAAGRAGGSADAFQGSIQGLQGSLQDMAIGGGGAASEALARLGINAVDATGQMRGVFDLLPEIAGQFENISKAQQIELGEKLGLDQGTIQLLQAGRKGVEDLVKRQHELGVATAEDAKLAATFNDALDDASQIFGDLTRTIGIILLPALTDILKGFETVTNFVRDNQEIVRNFFIVVAGIITAVYLPAIASAAAATLVAASPFIAIGAVIAGLSAAFVLLYDDIQNFLQGNDSAVGRIAQKWPIVGKIVNGVADSVSFLFGQFNKLYEFLSGKFLDVFERVSDIGGEISGFLGLDEPTRAVGAQTSAGITSNAQTINRNTSVSVGRVNVDARGGDSNQIAAGVSGALKDQVQQTMSNFDDGVMA